MKVGIGSYAVPWHIGIGEWTPEQPLQHEGLLVLAHELGVEAATRFLGKQDHIEKLIPQADVLLMPSEREAFGLAALEAMACGVPAVAALSGGVAELITDGHDGFLAPVGDTRRIGRASCRERV